MRVSIKSNLAGRAVEMVQDLDPEHEPTICGNLQVGTVGEQDVAHVMARALQHRDLAIDVGANVGFFSVYMSHLVSEYGTVFAYEPVLDNQHRLAANVCAAQRHNICLQPYAVGDTEQESAIYINADCAGGHAMWPVANMACNVKTRADQKVIRVRTVTLDDEWTGLWGGVVPKLIKIDVEGAEHLVLKGAAKLLRHHSVPYIIAELNEYGLEQLGSNQMKLRNYMLGFGYATFCLYYTGGMPKYVPHTTKLEAPYYLNLLFASIADVAKLWPVEVFDPTVCPAKVG